MIGFLDPRGLVDCVVQALPEEPPSRPGLLADSESSKRRFLRKARALSASLRDQGQTQKTIVDQENLTEPGKQRSTARLSDLGSCERSLRGTGRPNAEGRHATPSQRSKIALVASAIF